MADSSDSSPLVPFLGVLLGGGSSSGGLRRTLSTSATVGLSLFVLRFVATAAKAVADESDEESTKNRSDAVKEIHEFLKKVFQRMLQHSSSSIRDCTGDDGSEEENVPMIHQGSCHCRAVCFELIAPTRIVCKEAQNGKIQFRHARIRAKSFRFVSGAHLVRMYYVNKPNSNSNNSKDEVGAHSFCSRCGVHFLHAPNSHSTALDVNVDCLGQKDAKIKSAKGKKRVNLSAGIPVLDQWENDDADLNRGSFPATIAEEHLHTPNVGAKPFDKSSPFSAYKHHPLMRHQNRQEVDWDHTSHLDYYDNDDNTIDLVFPGGGSKMAPDTPSTTHTVYTTQTESMSYPGGGVPPTLTLDTTKGYDAESVVSLSSTKSGFPLTSSSSLHQNSFGEALPSPPSHTAVSPSTTALARHQMHFYMRKHMSSSGGASTTPTAASTPSSRHHSGLPLFPRQATN